MSGRIVVGINSAQEANEALDWALAEARERQAELVVICASPDWYGDTPADEARRARRVQELWAQVHARQDLLKMPHDAVKIDIQTIPGSAREALLNASQGALMLVLGRRRLGKIGRLMLGSVSSEVVERASVPVTVVRESHIYHRSWPIVVGVDSSAASMRALQHAAAEAADTGSDLHAVFAWQITTLAPLPGSWGWAPPLEEYQKFALTTLDKVLVGANLPLPRERVKAEVVHNSAAPALIAASRNASRIVVGARGMGGFEQLLLGSVSRQVLEYANCPVTVVR